jgi:hypothetical protein
MIKTPYVQITIRAGAVVESEVAQEVIREFMSVEENHGLALINGIEQAFQEMKWINCAYQGGCHRSFLNDRQAWLPSVDARNRLPLLALTK